MATTKEPKIVGKKRTVDFVKANPGCSNDDVARATDTTAMAARHRLRRLAEQGFLCSEDTPNVPNGGLKTAWYFLRDFTIDPVLFAQYEKIRDRDERAHAKRAQRQSADGRDATNVPAIFLLYQPPMPVRPRNARVRVNGACSKPTHEQGRGQEAVQTTGVWRNRNGASHTLFL